MNGNIRQWPDEDYPHQELTGKIIGAAIAVHAALGPGFVEIIYENAMEHELKKTGLSVRRQVLKPVVYDGVQVGEHRIDVLVNDLIVLELKVVAGILPVRLAQLKSTLKAAGLAVGLLVNFNVKKLAAGGIKRVINTD